MVGRGANRALFVEESMNRRRFLQGATLASGMALTATSFAKKPSPGGGGAGAGVVPRVCSTWDFGVAANQVAWKVLTSGGRPVGGRPA